MNQHIEHTILKADTSKEEVIQLCNEAIENNFIGVCIPPYYIKLAKKTLSDSKTKVVTVIGFPLGYAATPAKAEEVKRALNDGADEIDMVLNIAALKEKDYAYVSNDIESIATLVHIKGAILKVIIETALLSKEEKITAMELCEAAKVDFVKTSTGFSSAGATLEDIKLMRSKLSSKVKIKASGGIKTKQQANELIAAGADRIGTSSGVSLVKNK